MTKFIVPALALIGLALAGCAAEAPAEEEASGKIPAVAAEDSSAQPSEGMEMASIDVKGMTCGACEGAVTEAVVALEGVKTCNAKAQEGKVEVEYDPSKTDEATIVAAVNDGTDFEATL